MASDKILNDSAIPLGCFRQRRGSPVGRRFERRADIETMPIVGDAFHEDGYDGCAGRGGHVRQTGRRASGQSKEFDEDAVVDGTVLVQHEAEHLVPPERTQTVAIRPLGGQQLQTELPSDSLNTGVDSGGTDALDDDGCGITEGRQSRDPQFPVAGVRGQHQDTPAFSQCGIQMFPPPPFDVAH